MKLKFMSYDQTITLDTLKLFVKLIKCEFLDTKINKHEFK